jgi:hypothetical protein
VYRFVRLVSDQWNWWVRRHVTMGMTRDAKYSNFSKMKKKKLMFSITMKYRISEIPMYSSIGILPVHITCFRCTRSARVQLEFIRKRVKLIFWEMSEEHVDQCFCRLAG